MGPRRSMRGARVLLALASCVSLCCSVLGRPGEQPVDEITLGHEQIFVKFENGTTFSVTTELDGKVWELREDMNAYEGVASEIRMRFGDDIWPDYAADLSDYNIQAGDTVTLVTSEERTHNTVKFNVRTRDARELQVETQLGSLVSDLKDNITLWTGIPRTEQRLLLRGKELENERKLAHYLMYNNVTINLGAPLDDCHEVVKISIKTLSGATIELEIDLADTADGLKEKIWDKTGIPVGVQRLFSNKRMIIGQDHLCDLELEAGSLVYMYLYSKRITSLDLVARLRHVAGPVAPERAPIFREVKDEGEQPVESVSLYKDARNWIDQYPRWDPKLFNPVAHIAPNPDSEPWIQELLRDQERYSHPDASEADHTRAFLIGGKIKLSMSIRPYRVAANLSSKSDTRESPGITLGGGSIEVDPEKQIPLGADVNNWAPDAFSDADLMRLFEVSERVRQLLARAEQTGEGILSIASQRRINRKILDTYIEALAGSPPLLMNNNQTRENEECGICRDDLTVEPAIRLPCEHMFHTDCIVTWISVTD